MSAIYYLSPCSVLGLSFWLSFTNPAEIGPLVGYVGPGAGLSMMGALIAVTCVVLLAVLGPILYPIRLVRSMLRKRREQKQAARSS